MSGQNRVAMPEADIIYPQVATRFLAGVYLWMFIGLAITAVAAGVVASTPSLVEAILLNTILFWGLIIAEFVLVLAISAGINRISAGTATLLFLIYSVINGLTLSVILLVFTGESILQAFVGAGCLFAAMSIYGYATKRDLTSLGGLLFVGLIAIIVASLINLFLHSEAFDYVISIAGVLIFLGLTAYDTQKILRFGASASGGDSQMLRKVTIVGALQLYLDFINLFLFLLRLFGRRR